MTAEESLPAVAELRARFSHVVRLLRGSPARRRAAVRDAVLRWIAFSDAYPQRAVSEGPADRDALALSSGFLREAAGKKRDPVAVRLRRAAVAFAAGDVQTGLYWLRYAALADLRLAAAPQSALLERDRPLTSIERRELVYLARAGTPLMRVLAARRLCDEIAQPDVRATLQVLRCDPEAWVRAAAACW